MDKTLISYHSFAPANKGNVNLKIKGPKELCLTNISLNVGLDKIAAFISSPFNINLIENFKLTGSIIFHRVVLMVDDIYIHQITGINIRGVGFF